MLELLRSHAGDVDVQLFGFRYLRALLAREPGAALACLRLGAATVPRGCAGGQRGRQQLVAMEHVSV